ncbi:MAG: hypothetical protein AB7E81_13695 [Hyphomicrobiaceae bacterium]
MQSIVQHGAEGWEDIVDDRWALRICQAPKASKKHIKEFPQRVGWAAEGDLARFHVLPGHTRKMLCGEIEGRLLHNIIESFAGSLTADCASF